MGLADSILGANQADQYLQQIRERRNALKQSQSSSASALLDLAKIANNDASISNVEALVEKMPTFGGDNRLYKEIVKESIAGKRATYDMWKQGVDQANAMLKEQIFIPPNNKSYTFEEILNNGDLASKLPLDKIIDIQKRGLQIGNKVNLNEKLGMTYNNASEGYSGVDVTSKFANYQGMINTALTASLQDGTIDKEEIPYILSGREKELTSFMNERKKNSSDRLKEIESDKDTYASRLSSLMKAKADNTGNTIMSELGTIDPNIVAEGVDEFGREGFGSMTLDDVIRITEDKMAMGVSDYNDEVARFEKLHGHKYKAPELDLGDIEFPGPLETTEPGEVEGAEGAETTKEPEGGFTWGNAATTAASIYGAYKGQKILLDSEPGEKLKYAVRSAMMDTRQFLTGVGMREDDIDNFLNNPQMQKDAKQIDAINKVADKRLKEAKSASQKLKIEMQREARLKQFKDRFHKTWGIKYGLDKEAIAKLTETPGRWQSWKGMKKINSMIKGAKLNIRDLQKVGSVKLPKIGTSAAPTAVVAVSALNAFKDSIKEGDSKSKAMTKALGDAAVSTGVYKGSEAIAKKVYKARKPSLRKFVKKLAGSKQAQSTLGKMLLKHSPKLAAKAGISAGLTASGIGTLAGIAMTGWTTYEIYKLFKDMPEIYDMVMEEGDDK